MSAEAFDTCLTADLATAPDGRGVLVTESGVGHPRFRDAQPGDRTWASCYLNAELATRVAAHAVASQPLKGLSEDSPEKRALAALLLHATADLVRDLALDHAFDGSLTEEVWQARLEAIRELLDTGIYPPEGMSTRRDSVTVA